MLAVFPVATTARGGAPTYGDDFNPDGLNGGRKHRGVDIFAAEGTPLYAVEDGTIRMSEEKDGGHVVYLSARGSSASYFYGHLSAFEGVARDVAAGDVVGYVGHTGNAAHTSPHCHFEVHPNGTKDVVDPYPLLQAAQGNVATSGPPPAPSPTAPKVARQSVSLSLGAKALAAAYAQKHGTTAANAQLVYALEQAIGEGTFGPTYVGSNNWGSMHATAGFARAHEKSLGYGMLAVLDSSPSGYYIARLAMYPTPQDGAAAFLNRVEADVGDLAQVASLGDYAAKLYASGYYEGKHSDVTPLSGRALALQINSWTQDDEANIADYAALLNRSNGAAMAALDAMGSEPGDPLAITIGPPFAKLAHRLTPGEDRAPHTLEHAKQLLGKNATDPPAGAISLADALHAPGGDGVWLFAIEDVPSPHTVPTTSTTPSTSTTGPGTLVPSSSSSSWGWPQFFGGVAIAVATALTVDAVRKLPQAARRAHG